MLNLDSDNSDSDIEEVEDLEMSWYFSQMSKELKTSQLSVGEDWTEPLNVDSKVRA